MQALTCRTRLLNGERHSHRGDSTHIFDSQEPIATRSIDASVDLLNTSAEIVRGMGIAVNRVPRLRFSGATRSNECRRQCDSNEASTSPCDFNCKHPHCNFVKCDNLHQSTAFSSPSCLSRAAPATFSSEVASFKKWEAVFAPFRPLHHPLTQAAL
ncbi:hypothetical protein KP509_27G058600 [Ceratopteris richardii]|uniref:Uncharacterized protein n=1 Tax=Ceratopteris richardii TaxID=49495 RepID=A0A8T2RI78_CERRI|nr:hypothetical protein KP509_27G058600 [Ceratopteris richardii]